MKGSREACRRRDTLGCRLIGSIVMLSGNWVDEQSTEVEVVCGAKVCDPQLTAAHERRANAGRTRDAVDPYTRGVYSVLRYPSLPRPQY